MNSEELELSLRTEFESYLKNTLADIRQEVSEFQSKFQTEFEKHKSQLDQVFQDFSARIENDKEIDDTFKESVIEHLRLARDEGARITASAIAEAEAMEKEAEAAPVVSYVEMRDAIVDISSKDSQSAILKSLVHHAAQFTPRGAFFIIKNEHFVGWRVFGKEGYSDEQTVREVFLPMASDTILGEAVKKLSTAEGSFGIHHDDSVYLNKLEFGQPDRMYAIPLVARNRGVAVLYADYGNEGVNVNVEALETLVRIAGLTVELLAASVGKPAKEAHQEDQQDSYQSNVPQASSFTHEPVETAPSYSEPQTQYGFSNDYQTPTAYGFEKSEPVDSYNSVAVAEEPVAEETTEEIGSFREETPSDGFDYEVVSDDFAPSYQQEAKTEVEETSFEQPVAEETEESAVEEPVAEETEQSYSWSAPVSYEEPAPAREEVEEETPAYETVQEDYSATDFAVTSSTDFQFENSQSFEKPEVGFETPAASFESPQFEVSQFESPQYKQWEETGTYEEPKVETSNGFAETQYNGFETANGNAEPAVSEPVETVAEAVSSAPAKSRLSERNVDLPIQVADEERRLHNDARRFARLLVSEIKLYNEQKVKEGREGNDLYDRLREAIDRSREMYDKRVQPPVAAKFDYFHYELVSNLAEGDEGKLGSSYPGATV
ncbi:MAG: hypothetical protein LUM44_09605 [Pyrinomonadaceae bacterium]|nr:hypothetical protein [Pyrinomonadaceae bacterium]